MTMVGREQQEASSDEAQVKTSDEAGVEAPGLGSARQRRRPVVLVACVAMVCLGALVAVWAHSASTSSVEVLAVRDTIERGETIDEADLRAVQVSVDSSVSTIPAAEAGRLEGRRVALDVPAGGLLTEEAIAESTIPGEGSSIVGVTLPVGQLPGEALEVGDQVRVVDAPGVNAGTGTSGQGDSTAAEGGREPTAVSVTVAGVKQAGEGRTTVSVTVDEAQAASLASRAATGKVVIVLDSRER